MSARPWSFSIPTEHALWRKAGFASAWDTSNISGPCSVVVDKALS